MIKKVLIIHSSALMRSVLSDIINTDEGLEVVDCAENCFVAIDKVKNTQYDCIVLDCITPKMTGSEFLKNVSGNILNSAVVVLSNSRDVDNTETLKCLELGADCIIGLPSSFNDMKQAEFRKEVLDTILSALQSKAEGNIGVKNARIPKGGNIVNKGVGAAADNKKLIAIACSTGGPKALQEVIPYINAHINAPILIVQHMPRTFTESLAERLDSLSELKVKEAAEKDILQKGVVYIAKGGYHMAIESTANGNHQIRILDDPPRVGLKPCADIMYESLMESGFEQIICLVMTGMGCDGTNGIGKLKSKKNVYVIAQDKATSTVYGMPKAVYDAGLVDEVHELRKLADAVTRITGVR